MDENDDMYLEDLVEIWLWQQAEHIMKDMVPGTDEYAKACEAWNGVYQKWLEQKKIVLDYEDREKQREHEMQIEKMKVEANREDLEAKRSYDKTLKKLELIGTIGVPIATTAISLMFYGAWMSKGFKFEETGTYTSNTFKNFFRVFKPTRIG
jgi:hypothetical protein